ncbi:hypothetical protein [Peterkaempfera bronchialis]|uniref:Uncharacterized protein n=1 Tax=Peterkaempfera bronchialis TaxID=2126346 RepID=A0A345SRM2_9ACTN|nr:hypothetical protein [Peterkaempfera bronchialis]AXI76377.1 hypothetical protein C7M71_001665 [Peterkaempfera bronchialis]
MREQAFCFRCEQTARPAADQGGYPYLLDRCDAGSPAVAAYWLLARALDIGVQLDEPGLHTVWGELRDADEYLRAFTALSAGCTYVLELAVDDVTYCFTARPAAQPGQSDPTSVYAPASAYR